MTTPESFAPGYRLTDGNQLNFRIANPQWSTTSSVSATPGGTMATSAKVVNAVTNITNASAPGAGITLPQAIEGTVLLVSNNSGNDVRVFADGDSDINGLDGQIGILLAKGTTGIFTAVATKQWSQLNAVSNAGIVTIDTIASLRGMTVNLFSIMYVEGYYAPGDGGGGYFYGVSGGSHTDNGGTIITTGYGVTASSAWLRIVDGPMSVKAFGASPSKSAAINTQAIQNALNVSMSVFVPPDAYPNEYNINAPLVIGSLSTFNVSDSRLTSSDTGIIRFSGAGGTLIAYNAVLMTTSTAAGSAIALQSLPNACGVKIIGFPIITNYPAGGYTFGIDMTGFYRSYLEVSVSDFYKCIYADGSTYTTYYNVLQKPNLASSAGGAGIDLYSLNAMEIISPFISGAGVGRYGILFHDCSASNVHGGYVEAFDPNDLLARGLFFDNCFGITATGTTVDASSNVANYAIEVRGNSDGISLINPTFAGGWADSTKLILNTASGRVSLLGNNYGSSYVLGVASFPTAAQLASSATFVNDLYLQGIIKTKTTVQAAAAADYVTILHNTADGAGLQITTDSTNAGRGSLDLSRAVAGKIINTDVGGSQYPSILVSNGSPEGVYAAQVGSICMNRAGGAGTCFYVKESGGTGNTGWVAK